MKLFLYHEDRSVLPLMVRCLTSLTLITEYRKDRLGPVEFTEYSSPVFYVINQHGKLGHAYADDHQIYCSFHPDSVDIDCESIERDINDISSWMQSMKLKMNDSKTEYILIGAPQLAKCFGPQPH